MVLVLSVAVLVLSRAATVLVIEGNLDTAAQSSLPAGSDRSQFHPFNAIERDPRESSTPGYFAGVFPGTT